MKKEICEYCGREYSPKSYTQTYCSSYCCKRSVMLKQFLKTHDRCMICKKYGKLSKKVIAQNEEEYIMVCDSCHKYLTAYSWKLKKWGYKVSKGVNEKMKFNMDKMKMLTSDRIVSIRLGGTFDMPELELLEIETEKGMLLKVDKNRWEKLKVGDQINIGLEHVL